MNVEVGQLLNGTEKKDAIHVAIYPAIANKTLHPATPVTLLDENQDIAVQCPAGVSFGIVDPFLQKPVKAGERFYIFVNPNTITSLRHDWTHPALKPDQDVGHDTKEWAKRWMIDLGQKYGMNYDELMWAGEKWIDEGKVLTVHGTLDITNAWNEEERAKYWECIEIITGKKPPSIEDEPFSCSC